MGNRLQIFLLAALMICSCGKDGGTEPEITRGELRRLTFEGGEHPDWSDDGRLILYRRSANDSEVLSYIPAIGGQPVKILEVPGKNTRYLETRYPVWHPDPSLDLIAFVYRPDENEWYICTYSISASKLDTLFNYDKDIIDLDFTRDGLNLAFLKEQGARSGIWLLPLQGGEPVKVEKTTPWDMVIALSCDRDGDTVSYIEFEKTKSAYNVFTISLGGGEPDRITNVTNPTSITDQERSPDGSSYLLRMPNNIFIKPTDGAAEQITIMRQDRPARPTWSPDGNAIAFQRLVAAEQQTDIFILEL